jgi:hypothetical protein
MHTLYWNIVENTNEMFSLTAFIIKRPENLSNNLPHTLK